MRDLLASTCIALWLAAGAAAQKVEGFRFEVKTLGGQTLTEKDFENSALIVDLWGTWCGPCVQAVPALERLYRKYKQYGLEIVGFSYEGAGTVDPERTVRKFAARHGLTYHLAIGTPEIKEQVPGMRGYPTLLFFNRGLEHDHTQVGFNPLHEVEIERWARKALDLGPGEGEEEEHPADQPTDAADEEIVEPDEEPEPLPPGVVFKPGDGDTGFDFDVVDTDGARLRFQDLRGKTVVLALTSTWDGEAANTAALLNRLHDTIQGQDAVVLAASLELSAETAAKVRAIRTFRDQLDLRYRIFPAGMGFQKKIHLFSGMPLFLVFDQQGKLVLRETGNSEKTAAAIQAVLK